MNTKKIKKILATAMAISTTTSILPVSAMAMASNQLVSDSNYVDSAETGESANGNNDADYYTEELSDVYSTATTGSAVSTTSSAVYYNDFESDDKLPNQVNWNNNWKVEKPDVVAIEDIDGSKVLGFSTKFDVESDWSNATALSFFTSSEETIKANSIIQFDILIPNVSAENFTGTIKFEGLLQGGTGWDIKGKGNGSVSLSEFEVTGGYLRKTVSVKTNTDTAELKNLAIQIAGGNCNYEGKIYLDNIQLIAAEAQDDASLPSVSDMEWKFDTDDQDWSYGGIWDYKGPTDNVVNHDASASGSRALKISVDYSKDSSVGWSEFKISKDLGSATSFNGYNVLTYDFIYDPNKMTVGGFKTQLFVTESLKANVSIDLNNVTEIGDGLKKAQVTLKFTSQNVTANSITLGIIGSNTDYKGYIYIDNIKLSQEQVADKYVEKKVEANNSQTIVSNDKLEMPSTVKLVDAKSTDETADLYSYLMGVGKSDYVLYGHQNDTHHKSVLKDSGTNSDTKDLTGSIAAIVGIDTLSFTGSELSLTDEDKANGVDLITKAAQLGIEASNEGGIITVSAHMPNFAMVKEKGKIDGKYDYSGYSPNTTTGNIVSRIMPGGDLNDVYVGYLNMIAEYALELQEAGVPVLFRPFHENNGSWFWWGKAYCDEESYKNVFRYTVEYLRDTKEVHNFLYIYSPNGPFVDKADYLSRYPGDEFVDILAFDYYDDNPTADASTDPWMKSFKDTINLIQGIADGKGKLSTVSEVGIRNNDSHGAMAVSGNADKDWFNNVSNIIKDSHMPYYMVWANFDEANFFAPYMISGTKGHEMINEFINFYNNEESVFADGVGDYSSANTGVGTAYSYGFIIGPTSSSRILVPTTITASVKGYDGQVVKFVLKNKAGEIVETLNAIQGQGGVYSADITQGTLDKIGQTIGSIELYAGGNTTPLNTIKAIFNIKEAEINPKVVDDFELYSGEDALLQNAWSTNSGPGCNVTPKLSGDNKSGGEYGLAFNYKLAPNGWAGITKSLDVDWSGSDALQLWVKPDGKGQKLVIQLTSNGEDFEVWMPEFSATTEPKLLTIKFSDMKGKKGGTLDPSNIERMGIWCNTIGNDNIDSVMYFDNIKAINTTAVENPDDGSSDSEGGSSSGGSSNSGGGSSSGSSNSESSDKVVTPQPVSAKNNWIQENGSWKYVDESGTKVSNTWKQINGKWYYFNQDSTMKTGWLKDKDNKWYYLQADGAMKTDWIKDTDGNWYYLQSNGAMKTGWLLDKDNNWYYLQSSGAMKTGWLKDTDGNWYYLKANGAIAKNEYINGYWLGENGAWK